MLHAGRFRTLLTSCTLLALSACGSDATAPTGGGGADAGGTNAGGTNNVAGNISAGNASGGDMPGGGAGAGAGAGQGLAGATSGGTSDGGASGGADAGKSGDGGGGSSGASGSNAGGSGAGMAGMAGMAGAGGAPTLSQKGNPVYGFLDTFKSWLSTASGDAAKQTADKATADNLLTWQLPHGGFYKNGIAAYAAPWNGSAARSGWTGAGGVELGTIDNGATVTEIMFLADVYRRTKETKYRDGARKAFDFLFTMQYPSGGFPQVYPERPSSYSNHVTFNDDAMVRVLILFHQALGRVTPLDGDLLSAEQQNKLGAALAKGIEYILAAQIVQGGVKTVWCAQHDPKTYAALGARSYELPSKSGSESVGVVTLLMTQPQTAPIKASAQAAIAWYKRTGVADMAYVSRPSGSTDDAYNPIQPRSGATLWYRFYDLDRDVGFFSGRLPSDNPPGTGKQYDIMKIEAERRYGYQWGGSYGTKLFTYTDSVGY